MMKHFRFICILFIALFCTNAYSATVTMSANKNTIAEGDVFLLTINYSDVYSRDDIYNAALGGSNTAIKGVDFNVFNKDFDIVSKSFSSQDGYYNGALTTKKIWKIGLKPKRSGKITIQPIKIGEALSNYVDIEVKETTDVSYVPDTGGSSYAPYFKIEQSIDENNPYVQQQVTFLVKVFDNIGLRNGTINIKTDTYNDWFLIPLMDKPITKKETINNREMNVYYFMYAGFPQKSGNISIPQFVFDGAYIKGNNFDFTNIDEDIATIGSLFNNLIGQTAPVKMQTKPQKIFVKSIPKDFTAKTWLPLKDLKISASWSENAIFKVGEAVNRKITINATGMHSSYFPQIDFKEIGDVKQYPEKPVISEQISNGSIQTTGIINNVYIPQKAGEIMLPPIVINWFNVTTNKNEQAIIPAEKITVIPAEGENIANTVSSQDVLSNTIETKDNLESVSGIDNTSSPKVLNSFKSVLWGRNGVMLYIAAIVFVILIFAYIFRNLQKKNELYRNVVKSLKLCDYKKTKDCLLLWGKDKFANDDINNLHELSALVNNPEFTNQLLLLNKILYAQTDELFDAIKFIEIFKKVDKMRKTVKINDNILPDLYD